MRADEATFLLGSRGFSVLGEFEQVCSTPEMVTRWYPSQHLVVHVRVVREHTIQSLVPVFRRLGFMPPGPPVSIPPTDFVNPPQYQPSCPEPRSLVTSPMATDSPHVVPLVIPTQQSHTNQSAPVYSPTVKAYTDSPTPYPTAPRFIEPETPHSREGSVNYKGITVTSGVTNGYVQGRTGNKTTYPYPPGLSSSSSHLSLTAAPSDPRLYAPWRD